MSWINKYPEFVAGNPGLDAQKATCRLTPDSQVQDLASRRFHQETLRLQMKDVRHSVPHGKAANGGSRRNNNRRCAKSKQTDISKASL